MLRSLLQYGVTTSFALRTEMSCLHESQHEITVMSRRQLAAKVFCQWFFCGLRGVSSLIRVVHFVAAFEERPTQLLYISLSE